MTARSSISSSRRPRDFMASAMRNMWPEQTRRKAAEAPKQDQSPAPEADTGK